jgi:hypothetical protein
MPGLTWRKTAAQLGKDVSQIGKGGGAEIGSTIGRGATLAGGAIANLFKKGINLVKPAAAALSAKHERLIEFNGKLDSVIEFCDSENHKPSEATESSAIEFAGNPQDPTAGMFGGNDPGIINRTYQDIEQTTALERLRLKINRLRGMGLFNY